jgi:transcriptional regulator with XRE-family HTH domain
MKTKVNENVRELRRILGQTQGAFAATIGASKDTVASWETGRNPLSAGMARRISLATGVEEKSLHRGSRPLLTRDPFPRRPFTLEEFERHHKRFWGGTAEEGARRQFTRCADALELILMAAARTDAESGHARLTGVLDGFIEWCKQTRESFGLGKQIDAQLAERKERLELNHSYARWREMARTDPEMARKMGFKDDPKRNGNEVLRLSMETVPVWMPGHSMRGRRRD